jgi:hypothetical protein
MTSAGRNLPKECYLCGKPLTAPHTPDHVPPRQIYPTEVRKAHKLNLLTLRVHDRCNRSYQHDEDYFVTTLMPFTRGSYSGDALYRIGDRPRRITQRSVPPGARVSSHLLDSEGCVTRADVIPK